VGLCRKYICKRNSEAFIIKELTDKKPLVNDSSAVNLNDSLRAENITAYIKSSKTLAKSKCAYTGRHNSQLMSAPYFTHAFITLQFPNIPNLLDSKQVKGEKKQISTTILRLLNK
jgi:hypothetical protein